VNAITQAQQEFGPGGYAGKRKYEATVSYTDLRSIASAACDMNAKKLCGLILRQLQSNL